MAKRTRGFTVSQSSGSSKNLSPSLEVDLKDWNKLQEWTEPVPSAAPPTSQSVSIPPADAPNATTVAVLRTSAEPRPLWCESAVLHQCEQNKLVWVKVGQPHFFMLSVVDFFNNSPFCTSPVHALSAFWKKIASVYAFRNVTKALNSHISCRSIVATSRFTIF